MKVKSLVIFCLAIVVSLNAFTQREKHIEPLYNTGTSYQNKGWFVAPGITYMLPEYRSRTETGYVPGADGSDTLYTGDYKRAGRIGIYAEAGRHHFLEDTYLIHHIDYGIHFKKLTGKENFNGFTRVGDALAPVESAGIFKESFVGAFFNASNIIQVKSNLWLQNSLGVNADFRVISNRSISNSAYGAQMNYPGMFLAQLHYKIGFGWKPEPGIFILPMIETPILTAFPWDDGKSTLQYFSGRYRPLIFTLRIEWLSKRSARTCDPRPSGPGEVDKEKTGKHNHSGLWGPESKKMKKARKKQDGK